ncbi:MAG: nucleoside monophosphate kinase [Patescibacteria group bacterium]|nr:nucleoside monophosphate kinase [Patescibacteria group bacterium]
MATTSSKQKSSSIGAVVIFGYPGSGKSTQAQMIAERFGFYHFDTGRFVEHLVYDPRTASRPDIKHERKLFETGKLMDADFTLKHIGARIKDLAKGGERIVFSGSPRNLAEAFGDKKYKKGFVDVLDEAYGRKGVLYILLKVTQKESLERNSKRLVCSVCQTPLLGKTHASLTSSCPFCGGKLYRRSLDDPKTILVRFKEYEQKTLPIIQELRKKRIVVHEVSASAMPHIVFKRISQFL